jgi:hypothetical protein
LKKRRSEAAIKPYQKRWLRMRFFQVAQTATAITQFAVSVQCLRFLKYTSKHMPMMATDVAEAVATSV